MPETAPLSRETFLRAFAQLSSDLQEYSCAPFRSFEEGVPERWESYKGTVRSIAVERLNSETWRAGDIGTGRIQQSVLDAIEIRVSKDIRNNLVPWEPRPRQPSETARLREELTSGANRQRFESLVFDLYRERSSPEAVMSGLVDLLGRRYSLIAYLFFVYDDARFMPIAPTTFDRAFDLLGIDLRTSGQCSWANYLAFNDALRSVRVALREWAGIKAPRLIDAHSFLWLMIQVPDAIERQRQQGLRRPEDLKQRMIKEAYTIMRRVAQSNGQTVERVIKNKELFGFSSQEAFYDFLVELWRSQDGRCKLTGLPMLLDAPKDGLTELVFSVDRIDSSGHYSPDNLQLTCWFVNRWKGTSSNEAFVALVDILRQGEDAVSLYPHHFGRLPEDRPDAPPEAAALPVGSPARVSPA